MFIVGFDYRKACEADKKRLLKLLVFTVVLFLCMMLARIWLMAFPLIETETMWGDFYNLFVCCGFGACFIIPYWLLYRHNSRMSRNGSQNNNRN